MSIIRLLPLLVIAAAPAVLAGCGRTEYRTVVINPPPGQAVVIPPSGHTHYYYAPQAYTRQCPSEPDC